MRGGGGGEEEENAEESEGEEVAATVAEEEKVKEVRRARGNEKSNVVNFEVRRSRIRYAGTDLERSLQTPQNCHRENIIPRR